MSRNHLMSINIHEMTGFGGEVADNVPFIHQKGGFHGKVMGEMLFVHQNGSFDGETGLQERERGTKQGGASPLTQLAQPALNIRRVYLPDVVLF